MKIGVLLPLSLSLFLVSNFSGTSSRTRLSSTARSGKAVVNSYQSPLPDVEQRIRRIENGLLLPVVVKGQPLVSMTLLDRMQFYKTPGVSIAVINNGKIEWARGYGPYENTGQGVVIMTNSDRGGLLIDEIIRSIAREYDWADYQPKEKVIAAVDSKVYDAYAGQYELEISPDFVVTISAENGKLVMMLKQPTGQSGAELLPESENQFFRREVDFEMTFIKNDAGQVTGLIIRQGGAEYPAKKIK